MTYPIFVRSYVHAVETCTLCLFHSHLSRAVIVDLGGPGRSWIVDLKFYENMKLPFGATQSLGQVWGILQVMVGNLKVPSGTAGTALH